MSRISRVFSALALGLLCQAALAASPKPPSASTAPADPPAQSGKYVEPCACSAGQSLAPTQAVVFNCECGAMKCVVTAVAANNAKDSAAPNLVCR